MIVGPHSLGMMASQREPVAASYRDLILADNPIAYWRLDEMSGSTAVDETGNGYDGTYSGVTLGQNPAIADGGQSVYFDGSAYVDFGNVLNPTGSFTWEVWLKTSMSNGVARVIEKRGQGGAGAGFPGAQMSFDAQDDDFGNNFAWPNLLIEDSDSDYLHAADSDDADAVNSADGVWHLIHLVWDDDNGIMKCYQDAVNFLTMENASMIEAAADGKLDTSRNLNLGRANTDAQYLTGYLDECAIYPHRLTEQRITDHYNAGIGQS